MTDKRTQLEEVATDTVQRSGLQNLSFRTLADKVGVKSSSVHYYFPEKADLAASLIEGYTKSFVEKLNDIDKRKLSFVDTIDAFVKMFEDTIKADKFCLCGMMAAEVTSLNEANRNLLSDYFNQLENWLKGHFDNHKLDTNNTFDSNTLAQLVLSGLEGAILLDRVEGGHKRLSAQHQLIKLLIT